MNYHEIEECSISNGIGFRTVLYVSGCSLHCKGCHNSQAWNRYSGKVFDEVAKTKLFESINHPYINGLTLSGGHPLEQYNVDDVVELMKDVKDCFPDKDIWVYTGLTFKQVLKFAPNILEYADVIVDGPYIDKLRDITLKFRGSSNQRIWEKINGIWVDTTTNNN